MTRYKVESIFRDKAGKELRRDTTFDGEEADDKCALVEAHGKMHTICSADPRIDMISSVVTGGTHRLCTTDYADELGCGMSSTGLMNEIDASRLDGLPDTTTTDALDAVLTDEQKGELIDEGKIKEVAAQGGSGTFPGAVDDGRGVPGEDAATPARGSEGSGDRAKGGRQRDAGSGNDPGGVRQNSTGSVPVRQRNNPPPTRRGAPYQGTDIIGDIVRAKDEMVRALGPDRAPTGVSLGQDAYEALTRELEKQHPGKKLSGPILIAGMPIERNDDQDMGPIQIQTGRKTKPIELSIPTPRNIRGFATGGVVKDPMPNWLQPGENLIPLPGVTAEQMRQFGSMRDADKIKHFRQF